jgi:hypothetical protein
LRKLFSKSSSTIENRFFSGQISFVFLNHLGKSRISSF